MDESKRYDAMTVNERLYEVGLFVEYDQSVEKRDYEQIRKILRRVYLDESSIDKIIEKVRDGSYGQRKYLSDE